MKVIEHNVTSVISCVTTIIPPIVVGYLRKSKIFWPLGNNRRQKREGDSNITFRRKGKEYKQRVDLYTHPDGTLIKICDEIKSGRPAVVLSTIDGDVLKIIDDMEFVEGKKNEGTN